MQHGEWLPWLREHCEIPERTAQLYMRLASRRPQLEESATVADLTVRRAVALLTAAGVTLDDYFAAVEYAAEQSQLAFDLAAEHLDSGDLTLGEAVAIADAAKRLQKGWARFRLRQPWWLGQATKAAASPTSEPRRPSWMTGTCDVVPWRARPTYSYRGAR